MNFRPLYDRILIKPIEDADRTASGFYIPDTAKEKPRQGEVIATGEFSSKHIAGRHVEGEDLSPYVKVGDRVLFGKFSGTEIVIEGDSFLIMREEDIFGILNQGESNT